MTVLLLFAAGILIGAINAVAGGGMLIGFPTLLALGLPSIVANATSKLVALPGQITATFGYRSFLRDIPKRYFLLLIPILAGDLFGIYLLEDSTNAQFIRIVPYLILGAVALFAVQPGLKRYAARIEKHPVHPSFWVLSLCMGGISVYAGYFGAGYGFMMLAFLGFSPLESIHDLNAFKNLASSLTVLLGVAILLPLGLIHWQSGLIMGAGTAVGGYLAARAAPCIPTWVIRALVIVLGIATAIYFFL